MKQEDKLKEQTKKIEQLKDYINNQKDEMASMEASLNCKMERQKEHIQSLTEALGKKNKIIRKKNKEIEELRKESSKHLKDKIKVFYENQDLEKKANKYANMLVDAHDELRQLKKKLAGIVVNNVNAHALKSAEHALVEKDAIIQEKDEVIEDLGKELAETKEEMGSFKEAYKRRLKEDLEKFDDIKQICKVGMNKWLIESDYLEKDKPFRFPAPEKPCSEPKKPINTGISEMPKGNGILDQMVVGVDLGKRESYTSSVIIIPKETKPIEDEIMEGCKEMMRMNIKLMRDLFDE